MPSATLDAPASASGVSCCQCTLLNPSDSPRAVRLRRTHRLPRRATCAANKVIGVRLVAPVPSIYAVRHVVGFRVGHLVQPQLVFLWESFSLGHFSRDPRRLEPWRRLCACCHAASGRRSRHPLSRRCFRLMLITYVGMSRLDEQSMRRRATLQPRNSMSRAVDVSGRNSIADNSGA